jgi:hypothetical protein
LIARNRPVTTGGSGRNLPIDPQETMGRQAISTTRFALFLQSAFAPV